MESSEKSKYKFADALKRLMAHTPLDKITVKEIVKECGLTRQTFYRNFLDKYDLVNWYFDKLAQKSFKQMGVSLTLREGLIKKFQFIKSEQCFFASAFCSEDYNSLLTYDFKCILQFYTDIIIRKTGKPLDPDVSFLLEMYCKGSMYMTAEWARTGMKLAPEEITDLLIESLPAKLEELLSDLQ